MGFVVSFEQEWCQIPPPVRMNRLLMVTMKKYYNNYRG
jgi:hypothetical protein